ncbi:MAG: hypothetical protein D6741_04035 [Planctomycetota bacterium]|nr:MAG: hypothetical protein D6741_04035 [Planctomycetota bacterium]
MRGGTGIAVGAKAEANLSRAVFPVVPMVIGKAGWYAGCECSSAAIVPHGGKRPNLLISLA